MNIESKFLEDRLISHENTFGTPSVSNLALKFAEFVKDLDEKCDATSSLDFFIREVMLYLLDASNAEKTHFGSDISEYQELEENIGNQIQSNQATIRSLSEELSHQQLLRKHMAECEHLAKDVNDYQSQTSLMTETNKITNSLRILNDKLSTTDSRIEARLKQFQDILLSIANLQMSLKEDQENDVLKSMLDNFENDEDTIAQPQDVENDDVDRGGGRGRLILEDEHEAKKPRLDETLSSNDKAGADENEKAVEDGEVEEPDDAVLEDKTILVDSANAIIGM